MLENNLCVMIFLKTNSEALIRKKIDHYRKEEKEWWVSHQVLYEKISIYIYNMSEYVIEKKKRV